MARKIILAIVLILLCAVIILFFGLQLRGGLPQAAFVFWGGGRTHSVELREDGFFPRELTIQKGDTVIWKTSRSYSFWPASNLHPTHEIYREFDPRKPIAPERYWSFRFDTEGEWRYHDHLHPNYTGIISVGEIVLDENEVFGVSVACAGIAASQKQKCWDDLLHATLRREGLEAAFRVFRELYASDSSVPKACHGWAHLLGTTAFELFEDGKEIMFLPEMSYCGFGFYHGFLEQILQTGGDVAETKKFCDRLAAQSKTKAQYFNCLHGIGHGSIEIDEPRLWGDFQAMLEPGLKTCEAVLGDEQDRETCFGGVFDAMQLASFYGDYGLVFNKEDPFEVCRTQPKRYQRACYLGLIGSIVTVPITGHNFAKAVSFLDEISDIKTAQDAVTKLSLDFMQDEIVKTDFTDVVLGCRGLTEHLRTACFEGILIGFIAHGEPEREYEKALAFCAAEILTRVERDACYLHMAREFYSLYPYDKYRFICGHAFDAAHAVLCR